MSRHQPATALTRTALALVASSALALAGCGGSSHPGPVKLPKAETLPSHPTPLPSGADVGTNPDPTSKIPGINDVRGRRVHTKVQTGKVVQHASGVSGGNNDSVAGAPVFDLCKLVSAAQASAVLGATVKKQVDAPIGPTCVYELGGSRPDVTITFQTETLSAFDSKLKNAVYLNVADHPAYCGDFGHPQIAVQMGTVELLNISAPCSQARRLAAIAVPHVPLGALG
jgi:hypothetical protein